jgi:hypothetical protein
LTIWDEFFERESGHFRQLSFDPDLAISGPRLGKTLHPRRCVVAELRMRGISSSQKESDVDKVASDVLKPSSEGVSASASFNSF